MTVFREILAWRLLEADYFVKALRIKPASGARRNARDLGGRRHYKSDRSRDAR